MNHYERDRLMAVKKAREWTSTNFVILDTETTGLDDMGRIVELSCIDREGIVLVNSLVNPLCSDSSVGQRHSWNHRF